MTPMLCLNWSTLEFMFCFCNCSPISCVDAVRIFLSKLQFNGCGFWGVDFVDDNISPHFAFFKCFGLSSPLCVSWTLPSVFHRMVRDCQTFKNR